MSDFKNFVRVDNWIPKESDKILKPASAVLINIPLDKIFNESLMKINSFMIVKDSYIKKLDMFCHYINYFIKFYDTDNEVLLAYVKLRRIMADESITLKSFRTALYNIFFTDTIIEKIRNMVNDNYYISLSGADGKKYDESLAFNEEHAKVLMCISVSIKLIVPVVFHFLNTKNMAKVKSKIYRFYEPLFDIFGTELNLFNKLYNQVLVAVTMNHKANDVIWNQRKVFGINTITITRQFLREYLIVETIFKYVFNANIINMNHVIIRQQLGFFLKCKYNEDRVEITHYTSDDSGLSGLDKFEMSLSKIDEGYRIFSKSFIKKTLKRIKREFNMDVDKEELQYYIDNFNINFLHEDIVFNYFAKYFNGFTDLNMMSRKDVYKLIILIKKRLLVMGYKYLPYILTANIDGKINNRTIQNSRYLSKLMTYPSYKLLEERYYDMSLKDKNNPILNLISIVINSKFTLVDYNNPDKLGIPINLDIDAISCEMIDYLLMI